MSSEGLGCLQEIFQNHYELLSEIRRPILILWVNNKHTPLDKEVALERKHKNFMTPAPNLRPSQLSKTQKLKWQTSFLKSYSGKPRGYSDRGGFPPGFVK